MEDFINDELKSEVLQIFTCGCVDKIKKESKVSKNHEDKEVQASITKNEDDTLTARNISEVPSKKGPTLGVNVSCCMTHMSWRKVKKKV